MDDIVVTDYMFSSWANGFAFWAMRLLGVFVWRINHGDSRRHDHSPWIRLQQPALSIHS